MDIQPAQQPPLQQLCVDIPEAIVSESFVAFLLECHQGDSDCCAGEDGDESGGYHWIVLRRYSSLRTMHEQLAAAGDAAVPRCELPPFPPKRFVGGRRSAFIESRREALGLYMRQLLALPLCKEQVAALRDYLASSDPNVVAHRQILEAYDACCGRGGHTHHRPHDFIAKAQSSSESV